MKETYSTNSISKKKNEKNRRLFKGLVVPSLWDASGNVTGISLSTFNEEIYLIDNDDKGRELIDFVRKKVEIEGVLNMKGSLRKITVNSFRYFDQD